MKIKFLCYFLAVIATHSVASESTKDIERKCKRIEWKTPTASIPFDDARTATVQYVIVKGVTAPSFQTDEDLPVALRGKVKELANPMYRDYIEQEIVLRADRAVKADAKALDRLPKETPESLALFKQCYLLGIRDPESSAYDDAIKALNESMLHVQLRAQHADEQVRTDQYVRNNVAAEAARIESIKVLEQRRQNPPSNSAEVGPFLVTASSCKTSESLNFGALPMTAQTGSKFLILEATFKNVSSTSQFIVPGVLVVTYNGKSYVFNSIEDVYGDPLEVPSDPVNPLISQKVRVVYRISDEVSGKVLWQPGQNPTRLTVKCGMI